MCDKECCLLEKKVVIVIPFSDTFVEISVELLNNNLTFEIAHKGQGFPLHKAQKFPIT